MGMWATGGLTQNTHPFPLPRLHAHTYINTDPKFQWGGVEAPRVFFGSSKDGWAEEPTCSPPVQEYITRTFSQAFRKRLSTMDFELPQQTAARNVNNGFHIPVGASAATGNKKV